MDNVVISGAGPVGLTTALALAHFDIPVTVCEAGSDLSPLSRASTWHGSTLEILDELGVAWLLIDQGRLIPSVQYRDRDEGFIAEFNYFSLLRGDTSFPIRLQAEQSRYTRIVVEVLRKKFPQVEVLFNAKVVGVEDRSDSATATIETPAGQKSMEARFIVAADGAHSAVRNALKIGFHGETYPSRFLMVFMPLEMSALMPECARVTYISSPIEAAAILTLPDHWRVVFQIPRTESDKEASDPQRVQERLRNFLPPQLEPYPVNDVLIYGVHQRVADTYRAQSVFLAGDAGHLNNPSGGMGLNSGVHDAYMIATAIGEFTRGVCDASVFEQYANERRQAALKYVIPRAEQNYVDSEQKDAAKRSARKMQLKEIASNESLARKWLLEQSLFDSVPRRGKITTSLSGKR
jgi:2-polyprenyl-6-methoxyphenol hydroxylase-like FAD-dependent oxidoreductase